ncbi:MAG: hypothetical protein COA60_002305 [Robiginitomaculum sp.]|nr:hypothetical protein [Robiginitomaculum sp.]
MSEKPRSNHELTEYPLLNEQEDLFISDLSSFSNAAERLTDAANKLANQLFVWLVIGSALGIGMSIQVLREEETGPFYEAALNTYYYFSLALGTAFIAGIITLFYTNGMLYWQIWRVSTLKKFIYENSMIKRCNELNVSDESKEHSKQRNDYFDKLYKKETQNGLIAFGLALAVYVPYVIAVCFFGKALLLPLSLL